MEPKSLAATMFGLQQAIENCERSGNKEWLAKHRANLRALCKMLPSGSGIDNGTTLVEISTKPERIKLRCEFHHMNEHGSYDGWTEHTITVVPSFDGINVTIHGRDRNDIKSYLHEIFSGQLRDRVRWDVTADRWMWASEPECAATMKCLCAFHARGGRADMPCGTTER